MWPGEQPYSAAVPVLCTGASTTACHSSAASTRYSNCVLWPQPMSSREIRCLSQEMQVLFNKFHDRVRRDLQLQRRGVTILLSCTHRTESESKKLGEPGKSKICRDPSEAFEIINLEHGRVCFMDAAVIEHAKEVGLGYDGRSFSKH